MDPDHNSPQHRHQGSHGIPLQSLDNNGIADDDIQDTAHRRTLSERGRSLFSGSRRLRQSQRYTALSPTNLSPQQAQGRGTRHPQFFVSSPSGEHQRIPDEDDETELSPVSDVGAFQSAIGFAGLSFNAEYTDTANEPESDRDDTPALSPPRPQRMTLENLPAIRTTRDSLDDVVPVQLDDGPAFMSPGARDEDDMQPLTDSTWLRPSVLDDSTGPRGQRHDRSRRTSPRGSVHFLSSGSGGSGGRSGSRLGDNLHNLESGGLSPDSALGRGLSGRKRSLSNASSSAESAIQRTGTMLKNMSQRVVNLSNETDERTISRRSTDKRRNEHSPVPSIHVDGAPQDGILDAPQSPGSEKPLSPNIENINAQLPVIELNPLRGKSLGIFSPDNKLRLRLMELITHPATEPLILILIVVQVIILTIDSAPSVYNDPRPTAWGRGWTDYTIFVIFCIYTVEIVIKCIVSGFFFNPIEYSTIDRGRGIRQAMAKKANELFSVHRKPSKKGVNPLSDPKEPPSLLRSFTLPEFEIMPGSTRQAQRMRLAHRAFLRHSFNRLDFLAVISFWISISLGAAGIESTKHIWVFRMMSCLRILRLLRITNGTSVILRSLKRAAPILLNVGFLIGFFWLLFAIIGVQSFKASLRRQCQNNLDGNGNYTLNQTGQIAFCGGYLADNGSSMPWLLADGITNGTDTAKGYICPMRSVCIENVGPYNGTMSYDNIVNSLELVFVIMGSNTFSDIMYYLTNTDYLAAALFTAIGIIILNLWLINLLIAVITSSFQVIREEDKSSAFTDETEHHHHEKEEVVHQPRKSTLKKAYDATYWLWIAVIVYGLIIQALRSDTMGPERVTLIDVSETIVTLVLVGEIIFRMLSDLRDFSHHRRNWFDLFLAVITCIIQIPAIKNSGNPYAWLTFFQIVRIYRVVLAFPLTRDLILLILRFVTPVANLILFVFLLTFLVSILAVQLFRGELPQFDPFQQQIQQTFATIYNSFLATYQVFSSENWTTVMYNVAMYDSTYNTAWIGAAFWILWFILGFLIVLPMFIAVIQENFDVSEDQKRLQQVRMFLMHKEMGVTSNNSTPSLSSIFKFGRIQRQDPLDFGRQASEMLLKDAVVRDFLDEQLGPEDNSTLKPSRGHRESILDFGTMKSGTLTRWWNKITHRFTSGERNPFYSSLKLTKPYEELDPRTLAQEVLQATNQRRTAQRTYLRNHPTYNVSMYIFKPDHPVRRLCQRLVGPGRGARRIEGVDPDPVIWYAFSLFIYIAIVAMVLLACITTPLFQKEYFSSHPGVKNWVIFTDLGFAALFTAEAIVKVIADGLFFTPNAYFRSSWGFIDGVVLITLWANVGTYLHDPSHGSRTLGAFKALRALRLLNISDSARDTFHSVIILGGWKIVSAAFVSLSLLIPFAIYATNIFAGSMQSCNDNYQTGSRIANLTDCTGEFFSSPYQWNVLAPRAVANSYYDFDNFGDSLFILFQIVSQEGWIDVQWSAESITGVFTQPLMYSRQGNALFFVIFNLVATVFVLTLFVSVFMRTYTEQTGVAFLTADQRSWLEFSKLLRQVAPSKRPSSTKMMGKVQQWCYRRAIRKSGAWQRSITITLVIHLILLCLEFYPEPDWWAITRAVILFAFTLFYIAHIVVRLVGLSFTRFRKSAWDVYSVLAVSATFITAILVIIRPGDRMLIQANKLCLDSIVLLLIPRNNQLDQLFKTAAASLSVIFNLLATWFVLFLVYAIALTQTFGLTRFAKNETNNINVRTVPKALILLFRCSMGEGWNQIMEDYARVRAPYCVSNGSYYDGDCGSAGWARALFISWNILSMYIFVNLFIALIYESFSYVYQRSTGLSIISREEIRRFKQAWAEHDPDGSGFISKEVFPKFLNELSGVFEMRIYDGDFTIRSLVEDCQKRNRESTLPIETRKKEIDLALLNQRLAELPVGEIRRRRVRMNRFYEEVLVSADPERGISFNTLLMILAHYKIINDNKSLELEEFLRRRARLQRVEEAVNRNIVVGFFDTLYWSRQFKKYKDRKAQANLTDVPTFALPEILIQDEAGEDVQTSSKKKDVPSVSVTPVEPREIPSLSVTPVDLDPSDTAQSLEVQSPERGLGESSAAGRARSATLQTASTGSPGHSPHLTPHHRPSPSVGSQSSIQPDWYFAAALENASHGSSPPGSPGLSPVMTSNRSRAGSAVSQHEMMDMFGQSAWAESMRRSATQKRGSSMKRSQ
ncbi:hypothetical protein AMS68_007586 [Peltaster fructicola]|uniref:Calcium-channel protein CCH1 n=1 Tax=Peltaster fructicola TaxID=286661 RepID=A0A6H0Y5G3_9PEZI|nr:hypothetical protein AMS68_007586 [Peltaster fructicola]